MDENVPSTSVIATDVNDKHTMRVCRTLNSASLRRATAPRSLSWLYELSRTVQSSSHTLIFISTLCALILSVQSIAIDNDVVGEPEVECLEEEVRFWIKTRKLFAGRMYAKNKVEIPGCLKADFTAERTTTPHWNIKFGTCGMKSLRSTDPKGMYYGITVVVSFHPLFITKVDQAFHVKCFFEETSKGLTAELGVSMIPTTEVLARHSLPGCVYSMHKSTIADLDAGRGPGEPIKFARVGDKVLHMWSCDDPMFGVLINNCYVTDGFGQRAEVVDQRGCPIDPILITGIRYSQDLMRAYAESHVFKFADKPGVWFFCQIQMCMKSAGMCQGITPPNCGGGGNVAPVGGGAGYPSPPVVSPPQAPFNPQQPFGPQQPSMIHPGSAQPSGTYTDYGDYQAMNNHIPFGPAPTYQPPIQYSQQPLTPFGPAFPANEVNYETPPVVNYYPDPSGVPLSAVSRQYDVFQVTTSYETEIPIIYESTDPRGVSWDTTDTTPLPTTHVSRAPRKLDIDTVIDALPPSLRNNTDVRKVLVDNKQDQRFLQNALYRARHAPEEIEKGAKLGQIEAEWLGPAADDPPPEIAGQLIIFDLDEDPPSYMQLSKQKVDANGSFVDESDEIIEVPQERSHANSITPCLLSPRMAIISLSALLGTAAFFFITTCILCRRQYGRKRLNGLFDDAGFNVYESAYERQQRSRSGSHTRQYGHSMDPRYRR